MEGNKCNDCGINFGSAEALKQHKEAKHAGKKEGSNWAKKQAADPVKLVIYGIILVAGIAAAYVIASSVSGSRIGSVGSTHEHVDFMVYIEGTAVDFSKPKYQLASQYIHMENGIGTLIHKHATGVTLGDFLKTVSMDMDKDCFKADTGKKYCNNGNETLKFYLNGKLTTPNADYNLRDLDKFLISYGNETGDGIKTQLNSITDLAKIESGKPE